MPESGAATSARVGEQRPEQRPSCSSHFRLPKAAACQQRPQVARVEALTDRRKCEARAQVERAAARRVAQLCAQRQACSRRPVAERLVAIDFVVKLAVSVDWVCVAGRAQVGRKPATLERPLALLIGLVNVVQRFVKRLNERCSDVDGRRSSSQLRGAPEIPPDAYGSRRIRERRAVRRFHRRASCCATLAAATLATSPVLG